MRKTKKKKTGSSKDKHPSEERNMSREKIRSVEKGCSVWLTYGRGEEKEKPDEKWWKIKQ